MVRNVLRILTTTALVAAPLASASAQTLVASTTPVSFSGTGLGTVATILTLSSQGNATTEAGCVGRNASGDFFGNSASGQCAAAATTPDVLTGASQSQTQLLSALGIDMASEFGILLNATEPGGPNNSITVTSLTANFYSAAGAFLGGASLVGSPTFSETFTGIGNTGYLFTLSGAPAGVDLAATGVRVGLSAGLSNATGGPDTFFLVNAQAGVPGGPGGQVVPEPSTYMLLGTGLLGLAGLARRRRQS